MGTSADEIARRIAETRDGMEERIVTLRQRSEVAVQRSKRALLVAAGVGAGIGVVAVGAFVAWRLTRPVTARERVARIVPPQFWDRVQAMRKSWELGVRRQVPPVRMYVGDRQVGEEPAGSTAQKVALRVAQAAGTAIGGAIVQRILSRLESRAA